MAGRIASFMFTVSRVESKSNFRNSSKHNDQWRRLKAFDREVALEAMSALPARWDVGDPSKKVSERPVVVMAVHATSMLDSGNVTKSIADAVEGVVYVTDASVAATCAFVDRKRGQSTATIGFALLPAGASTQDTVREAAELFKEVSERATET